MSEQPLVSVIMPVFNAAEFLLQSLTSIVNQTYRNLEIVIVDDACTDSSMDIVQSFRDTRVVVLKNRENLGLAASLNLAIRNSSGKFLARMDADDIAYTDRLEKQVMYLTENRNIDVLGTAMQYFGESRYLANFPETNDACKSRLLFNVCFGHPSVMFRKEIFEDPGNYYNADFRQYSEEYDLWCRLSSSYRFHNMQEVLMRYRTYPAGKKHDAELRRKNNSATVQRNFLLKQLGSLSDEQWQIHRQLSLLEPCTELSDLRKIDEWINQLINLNKKTQAFNDNELKKQIAHQFFEVCYSSLQLGQSAMSYYLNSEWVQLFRPSAKARIKRRLKQIMN